MPQSIAQSSGIPGSVTRVIHSLCSVQRGHQQYDESAHAAAQVVRAPVALAMVKLLRLLPEDAARATLPATLQGVANLLRNRLQRFRCALTTPGVW